MVNTQKSISLLTSSPPVSGETKTPIQFCSGPVLYGHRLEYSDVHRAIRFDQKATLLFSEVEYQLFFLLLKNHEANEKEVSYRDIAERVFGCPFYEELLPVMRKRISVIRRKISGYGIDILNIAQRGYELRTLTEGLIIPYKRGHRVEKGRRLVSLEEDF